MTALTFSSGPLGHDQSRVTEYDQDWLCVSLHVTGE